MHLQAALLITCLSVTLIFSNAHARAIDTSINTGLQKYLVGDWCLNKEEYQGDISFSGDIWSFYNNGQYEIHGDEIPYQIINESIKMDDFGELKVLQISENEMVAKVHSTYYFSKPRCSKETISALKITQLNNAIVLNNIEHVQQFIDEGIDVSKADLRSSLQSTPLMLAVKENNEAMVALIIKQKPDLSVTNFMGKSVLDLINKKSISENIREMVKHANNQ